MLQENTALSGSRRAQGKGGRSREKILDAAETLFSTQGFAATSISAICRDSGLPASSVYWHFQNKDGLLRAVMERGANRMLEDISSAYEHPGTPQQKLGRILRRASEVFMARPREFQRLEMLIALERGGEDETWREASDRFRTGMRSLVEGALFEIFRDAGENLARQVAAEGVDFAEILGDGATFGAIRDPEGFDHTLLAEQVETALLGMGERRMKELREKGGPS